MHVVTIVLACAGAVLAAGFALWRAPALPGAWSLLGIALIPSIASIFNVHVSGMFLVSMLAIAVWGVKNRHVAGIPAITIGVCLNLLVMAVHAGAMPIDTAVLAQLGESVTPGTVLYGSKDVAVASSRLWLLSDWIALSARGYTVVISPGDAIICAGIVWWLLGSRAGKDHRYACSSARVA